MKIDLTKISASDIELVNKCAARHLSLMMDYDRKYGSVCGPLRERLYRWSVGYARRLRDPEIKKRMVIATLNNGKRPSL